MSRHQIKVQKMDADNPFRSLGFKWEWSCSGCGSRGGTFSKAEATEAARSHVVRDREQRDRACERMEPDNA